MRSISFCRFLIIAEVILTCSCVPTNSIWVSKESTTNQATLPAVGEEVVAENPVESSENILSQVNSNSSDIMKDSLSGLSISKEEGASADKFSIKLASGEPVSNVLKLTNPPRLVVDVLGVKGISSKEYSVADSNTVSAIRVGSHNDKTRIVFDLSSEEVLKNHLFDSSGNQIVLTMPISEEEKSVRLAKLSSQSINSESRAQLGTDEANNAENNEFDASTDTSTEVNQEEANSSNAAIDSANKPTITAVNFEKTSGSAGEVKITLTDSVAFEVSQTSQSEFVLSLPGVSASEDAKKPMVAAKGEEGIRSVRLTESEEGTLVRMFVDAGISVSALPRGQEIIVKAGPFSKNSARGQLEGGSGISAGDKTAQSNPTGLRSADGSKTYAGRLISLDLQDTDIDNALRIIAEVSNLNIIASDEVSGKVTLRLIDVPWDQALDVILKTNGLDQVTEGNVIRIAPVDKLRQERESLKEAKKAAENLEDLTVKYIRVSYARAEEIKPKVEAVLSERGTITADERTNQLIIKDIQSGQKLAAEILKKLDLRTPQVLLETQIVEGGRSILRDLGFQWNFSYVQSPATGNATGINFPNSVALGGGASDGANNWAVNFPAAITANGGTAVTAILDSADGSRLLGARLTALETEGKVKVVSKPQVATINNKQAKIGSTEVVRVRVPAAGATIGVGAGANAQGGGAQAFQEFRVGIELDVTPQASPDYYVLMDVKAKSSTFSGRPPVDGVPNTLEREATSTILVKSGQTFALGGVYRISDQDAVNGVPFLKDIPFLGHFFRSTFINKTDEELIFFITPHIVEGSFDADAM